MPYVALPEDLSVLGGFAGQVALLNQKKAIGKAHLALRPSVDQNTDEIAPFESANLIHWKKR